ncbi:hypothetical protein KQ51_00170 [Candidatus Izimaplasma bacterium HR1]|jgi:hypothetical protein|uniref:hypothetical protein n=1 Tax=Candidatus Izimoplasma sp. HR1 TaxID=1541959 RepID=UPI0004F71500|nr:hypothetical protein KQ51_00170 [Candidatus Izimaplasma bacterium HR1]
MELLFAFSISFIISFATYYLWYKNKQSLDKKEYAKNILLFAFSMALVILAMIYLSETKDFWMLMLILAAVSFMGDNVIFHTFFKKGMINFTTIDQFIPGIINNGIIFILLYFLVL